MEVRKKYLSQKDPQRAITPSTAYSVYSTPALSPQSCSKFIFSDTEFSSDSEKSKIDTEKVLYDIYNVYFDLDSKKNQINQACIKLITRENSLKKLQNQVQPHYKSLQKYSRIRCSSFDLDRVQANIKMIEEENLKAKKKLDFLMKDYFFMVENAQKINRMLKEILDKSSKIEDIKKIIYNIGREKKLLRIKINSIEENIQRIDSQKTFFIQEDNKMSKIRQEVLQKKKEAEVHIEHAKQLENSVVYEDTRIKRFKNEIETLEKSFKEKLVSIEKRKALLKKREMDLQGIKASIEDSKCKNCERVGIIQGMHNKIKGIETEVNIMEKNLEKNENELKASAALLHSQFYILQKTY
ncbi:hypothetical protein SteCoe_1206 [Stentor coeruleus]|uniref:Uncharacterized protein n=1 Tax=Stentor coeruleus TaxID=5963 RepID=A0A1R2D2E1_9CILI|nr:hypothetical protein SteCoe_1206 [Stentor coeruleus]